MHMKIFVYILLIVAYAVYQMYKKQLKNPVNTGQTAPVPSEEEAPQDSEENLDLEAYIRKYFQGFPDEEEEEQAPFAGEDTIESGYEEIEQRKDFSPGVEENYQQVEAITQERVSVENDYRSVEYGTQTIHEKIASESAETEELNDDTAVEDPAEIFDLEKAVIYDAILNRPYG